MEAEKKERVGRGRKRTEFSGISSVRAWNSAHVKVRKEKIGIRESRTSFTQLGEKILTGGQNNHLWHSYRWRQWEGKSLYGSRVLQAGFFK